MLVTCYLSDRKKKTAKQNHPVSPVCIPWQKIAVLIPVAGAPDHLPETIASVLDASGPGITLCVIDNGPTHLNSEIIRKVYPFEHLNTTPNKCGHRPIKIQHKNNNCKNSFTNGEFFTDHSDLEQIYCCHLPEDKDIYILEKSDKGKGKALNLGIHFVSAEYIICLDADSILEKNAIRNIMMPMLETETPVFAVGGVVLPVPENNLLCRLQESEYMKAFFFARSFFSALKQNLLISGAFGAFRKDILTHPEITGYDPNCIGEDLELTVKIQAFSARHRLKNVVRYTDNAFCYTHVPDSFSALFKQRTRWQSGLIQGFHLYPALVRKGLRCFTWSYFYFYERLSPIMETTGLILLIINIIKGAIHPVLLLLFPVLPTMINFITTLYAYGRIWKVSKNDVLHRSLSGSVPHQSAYRLTASPHRGSLTISFFAASAINHLTICLIESVFLHPMLLTARIYADIKERLHRKTIWK